MCIRDRTRARSTSMYRRANSRLDVRAEGKRCLRRPLGICRFTSASFSRCPLALSSSRLTQRLDRSDASSWRDSDQMKKALAFFLTLTVAWAFLVGLVILSMGVPETRTQWIMAVIVGPPLYVAAEAFF